MELVHLTKDRAMSSTKNPALDFLVAALFPGKVMEGKLGDESPRLSDWSGRLSVDQMRYASNDGYAERIVYQRLMQIMNPRALTRLLVGDIEGGLEVTLYLDSWKSRVAIGTLTGKRNRQYAIIEVDFGSDENIYAPGKIVQAVNDDGNHLEKDYLAVFRSRATNHTMTLKFEWKLHLVRRTVDWSGSENPVSIHAIEKQVLLDYGYDNDNMPDDVSNDDFGDTSNRDGIGDGNNGGEGTIATLEDRTSFPEIEDDFEEFVAEEMDVVEANGRDGNDTGGGD